MASHGTQHQTANDIQKVLLERMDLKLDKGKDLSSLANAWIDLERLKREMRGIAPLKASDAIGALRHAQRPALAASSPIEITSEPQVDKESLKHSQEPTVTAPPSQTPHHLDE